MRLHSPCGCRRNSSRRFPGVPVCHSFSNRPVNTRFEIGYFLVDPIGKDAPSEFGTPRTAAAIVDGQDHISLRGKNLAFYLQRIKTEWQAMIVLAVWAAMNPNDQRILLGRVKLGWFDHEAVNLCSIFAL